MLSEKGLPLRSSKEWGLDALCRNTWNAAATEKRRLTVGTCPRVIAAFPTYGPGAMFFKWNDAHEDEAGRNLTDSWYQKFVTAHSNMDRFYVEASRHIPV